MRIAHCRVFDALEVVQFFWSNSVISFARLFFTAVRRSSPGLMLIILCVYFCVGVHVLLLIRLIIASHAAPDP